MPRITSSVSRTALKYFSTISHKRNGFQKKVIDHKNVCFDFLLTFSPKQFSF
jgi:hypothetical protein